MAARNGSTAAAAWLSLSLPGTAASPVPKAWRAFGLLVALIAVRNGSTAAAAWLSLSLAGTAASAVLRAWRAWGSVVSFMAAIHHVSGIASASPRRPAASAIAAEIGSALVSASFAALTSVFLE